ncbi:MAG: (2Fe-2S)-binding protein [Thiobacillus sp.]
MYVCLCKGVTDHEIRRLVQHHGVTTMRQLRDELGVSTACGRCARYAKDVLREAVAECRGCSTDAGYAAAA